MRTLLACALATLCASAALAQGWPGTPPGAYYPAAPAYPPPAPYGYAGYAPPAYPGYAPPAYPGYAPAVGPFTPPPAYPATPAAANAFAAPAGPAAPAAGPAAPAAAPPPGAALPPAPPPFVPPGPPVGPLVNPLLVTPEQLQDYPFDLLPWAHRPCEYKVWFNGAFTTAWIRQDRLSGPLVTTGSVADPRPGALGQPNTLPLFADELDYDTFLGVRAEAGVFLDHARHWSLDVGALWLAPRDLTFAAASDPAGNPLITRPFYNAVTNLESAFITAFPAVASGLIVIDADSNFFTGEFNARYHCCVTHQCRLDGLVGFRYLRLDESLTIRDSLRPLANGSLTFLGVPVRTTDTIMDLDSFSTSNDFYGGQIGARLRWEWDKFTATLFGKAALGAVRQQVDIAGASVRTTPLGRITAPGGVLALPSNIGSYERTVVAFVPEGGLDIGVRVHRLLLLKVGYSFLLCSDVARPSGQIDRVINAAQVPTDVSFGQRGGPARPQFPGSTDYFWVQSVNFGFEVTF